MTALDQTPQWSEEAEAAVVGACLTDPEAVAEVRDLLRPEDLYLQANRTIFRAVADLAGQGKPISLVAVDSFLRERGEAEGVGGMRYLTQLSEPFYSAFTAIHQVPVVVRFSKLRQIRSAAESLMYESQAPEADPAKLCSDMAERLYRIGISQTDDMLDLGRDVGKETWDEMERQREAGGLLGTDTGIPALNKYVPGWASGLYYLIGGRPSASKSAFALQQCIEAAMRGKRVLFFSLEMPTTMVGRRYLAHMIPHPLRDVMEAKLGEQQWRAAAAAFHKAYDYRFRVCPTAGLTISQIRARARTWAARWGGLDLIAVDYLQLAEADGRTQNDNARVSAISRGLKIMARETSAAVLALSQLNRRCEDERRWPQLHDLRDSGSLEQDADAVLFLHYPWWLLAAEKPDPEVESITKWTKHMRGLYVAKNRNGMRVMMPLAWNGDYQRFEGLESERQEER